MEIRGLRDYRRFDRSNGVLAIAWTLGDLVRKLREERGWNQQQLADAARLHKSAVVRLEGQSGKSERTTIESAARALNVDVSDLFALEAHAKVFAELSATQRVRVAEVARQYAERNRQAANRQSSEAPTTVRQEGGSESAAPAKARRVR